jgi:hypothetical protein
MAYNKYMELIETSVFTKLVNRLLDEITYAQFKEYLVCNPEKGKVIPGGGGIRKMRWGKKNTGKRGGVRIIYFIKSKMKIYLLYIYAKNEASDLSRRQIKELADLIKGL